MRPSAPRIAPVAPQDFTEEQAAIAGDWRDLTFTQVMVRHPTLYRAFMPMGEKLMRGSDLPPRDREILVLRTVELCRDTYEAAHHVLIARNLGMTDEEIAAARAGRLNEPFDRTLATAAEELVGDHRLSDEIWALLAERYSLVQLMELVFLVGDYTMLSMVTNSFGMAVEGDLGPAAIPNE
ncbi:carboxymuconolactone decarboxylase family protein [Phenylobacterium sp. LjRoot225]|uniref:carboxymuconolactone decarboxylase family protein n=1 Tax=Phenylobacterium sp. LjRoot225 TaxID=3342285 RepID=UPI003ECE717B